MFNVPRYVTVASRCPSGDHSRDWTSPPCTIVFSSPKSPDVRGGWLLPVHPQRRTAATQTSASVRTQFFLSIALNTRVLPIKPDDIGWIKPNGGPPPSNAFLFK